MYADLLLEKSIPHKYSEGQIAKYRFGVRTFFYDGPITHEFDRQGKTALPLTARLIDVYKGPRFFGHPWGVVMDVQKYHNQLLIEYFTAHTAVHAHLLGALYDLGYSEEYLQQIGREGKIVQTGIPHFNPKFTLSTEYGKRRVREGIGLFSDFNHQSVPKNKVDAALNFIELVGQGILTVTSPDLSENAKNNYIGEKGLLYISKLPGRNVIRQTVLNNQTHSTST